jgi:hypothetical protein
VNRTQKGGGENPVVKHGVEVVAAFLRRLRLPLTSPTPPSIVQFDDTTRLVRRWYHVPPGSDGWKKSLEPPQVVVFSIPEFDGSGRQTHSLIVPTFYHRARLRHRAKMVGVMLVTGEDGHGIVVVTQMMPFRQGI